MVDILGTIAAFKDELLKAGGIIKDELEQYLDKGLQKYIVNYKDKYSVTKTFLFRDNQVNFYDIYFPLCLCHKKDYHEVPNNIDELFAGHKCITILGYAGSGKTMLLKHCFLSCLKSSGQIPVVIELRRLNSYNGTLVEYIKEFVFNMNLAQNNIILERMLMSGKFTFFLDGFDEISLSTKEIRVRELESFIDSYMHNYYLLTSRPDANAESLQRFENYRICKLGKPQIKQFVNLQLKQVEDGNILEKKILELIDKKENVHYLSYLSNPLLLSMFILTFNNYPELPKRKSNFYYNVFDTLYSRHDTISKSGGYVHDKKTSLERHNFELLLKKFSYISLNNFRYSFTREDLSRILEKIKGTIDFDFITDDLIYDLSVSISILINDGVDYTFPHRSLQEYFAALLISNLNEDAKKSIYNKADRFSLYGHNFMSLCEELDSYCFKKYFLLYCLDYTISKIEMTNDGNLTKENVFINFMEYFDSQIIYADKQTYLMSFCSIGEVVLVNLNLRRSFSKIFLENSSLMHFVKLNKELRLKNMSKEALQICYNSGLCEKIYEIYEMIKLRKAKIEKDLKVEDENNNLFLDINI